MRRLSKMAEELLKDILENRNENGTCKSEYWQKRFENLSVADDAVIRSLFKQLEDFEMISARWADNYPYFLVVLANGLSYFEEIDDENKVASDVNYINHFYGNADGVQIQQGSNGSQVQYNESQIDDSKVKELLDNLIKYDVFLNDEYGVEKANELREYRKSLSEEVNSTKKSEKIRGILKYMRELSINAGGGVIAAGVVQLITSIIG